MIKNYVLKKRYPMILLIIWTAFFLFFFYFSIKSHEKHSIESEKSKVKILLEQNLFLCHLAAMYGGLFVPENEFAKSNPSARNFSEKGITTSSGEKLVLINPLSIISQLMELSPVNYKIKINIADDNWKINSGLQNDAWESEAIEKFKKGATEKWELIDQNGKSFMRYMIPFVFAESCSKCHGNKGYKTGELIGGLSIYYPVDDALKLLKDENKNGFFIYFAIWSMGLGIIIFLFLRLNDYIVKCKSEETKLKESEELLWTLINSIPDIICFKDGECRWIKANDAILRLFQLKNTDYVMKKDHELASLTQSIYQDVFRFCAETDKEAFNSGKIQRNQEIILDSSGNSRCFDVIKSPLFNEDGSKKGIIVIGRDISDEKNYEEELQKHQEFLTALLNALPVAFFYKDKEGRYLGCNKKYEELFNISENDIIGKTVFDIWDQEEAEIYHQKDIELMENPIGAQSYEFKKRTKGHDFIEGIFYKSVFRDEKGEVAGIIGVFSELSEIKKKEKELGKLASVIEQINDAVIITDKNGKIEYINPAFNNITGYNANDIKGKYLDDLVPMDINYKKIDDIWYIITSGDIWIGQVSNRKKDGALYEEELTVCPIKDKDGNITNYVALKRDITDKRMLQFQLTQSQKMESLGRLASGIAHDFNNMLAVIQGNLELSAMKLGKGNLIEKNIATIQSVIEKGAGLVRQLLCFSRTQPSTFTNIDLNQVILHVIGILNPLIGENIKIETYLNENIPLIKGDSLNIEQIILNLSLNARDAMSSGGTIIVRTEHVQIDESDIRFLRSGKSGDFIALTLEDTGKGMDHDTLSRIFEPFFTTKEHGKGTGLGLYVVYAITQQHNAIIEASSELDKGTSFRIYFPAAISKEEKIDETEETEEDLIHPRNKRILLVEDEEKVRDVLSDILTISDYMVIEADCFESAMKIFEKEKDNLDMIVTDFMLPDKNGFEFLEICKKEKSEIKAVIISGYLDLDEKLPEIGERGYRLFPKPFKANDFIDFIDRIFHEGS